MAGIGDTQDAVRQSNNGTDRSSRRGASGRRMGQDSGSPSGWHQLLRRLRPLAPPGEAKRQERANSKGGPLFAKSDDSVRIVEQLTIHSNSLQDSLRYLRSSLARLLRRTLECEQGARPAVVRPQQCLGKVRVQVSKHVTSQ